MAMRANGELKQLLTRLKLRQLAGSRTFEHGADYFAAGQVVSLAEQNGKLTATVQGTEEYHVTLFAEGDAIASDCTCPMGSEGAFCKHCVAVGLAWLANGSDIPRPDKPAATPAMTLEEARAWLAKLERNELVDIIVDQATRDARLREKLFQQAGKQRGA